VVSGEAENTAALDSVFPALDRAAWASLTAKWSARVPARLRASRESDRVAATKLLAQRSAPATDEATRHRTSTMPGASRGGSEFGHVYPKPPRFSTASAPLLILGVTRLPVVDLQVRRADADAWFGASFGPAAAGNQYFQHLLGYRARNLRINVIESSAT